MPELILVIIIGACFGSLVSALSYRLPRNEPVLVARSKCPSCQKPLSARDLIPVISWLRTKGKCRQCNVAISKKYVILELIQAGIFGFLYFRYGFSPNFFLFAGLSVALLILIISDLETYIIPDSCSVITTILGLAYIYYGNISWQDGLIGAGIGLFIALLLSFSFRKILKKEALGFGDVKFMAASGLWLGFELMPPYFILSGVLGIILGIFWKKITKQELFPFGPALAVSLFILLLV